MTRAARTARIILLVSAMLLPSLSLIPLGGLYLWEKGWLLPWAIAALAVSLAVYLSQRWLLTAPPTPQRPVGEASRTDAEGMTPAEAAAWAEVRRVAAGVDIDKLDNVDAVLALGQRTLDAVSRKLHPGKPDAVWQFTLPEALAIVERVSRRLGRFTVTSIPFGDRLTVAQVLRAYSWRGFIDVAEKAYDVWRVLRVANPATAVTHEARERLSKAVLTWGREHVSRRFAEAYVEEVGRAAIDLYGGRLRVAHGYDSATPARLPSSTASHVTVLIVGGAEASRRQLAATIEQAQADHARAVVRGLAERGMSGRDGEPAGPAQGDAVAVDVRQSRINLARLKGTADLVAEVRDCDVLMWIMPADGAAQETDFAAATAIAESFRAAPALLPPVLLPVVAPDAARSGAAPSADTRDRTVKALATAFGAPQATELVVTMADEPGAAQRDLVWSALERLMPAALRVRAVRRVEDLKASRPGLVDSGRQAASALANATRGIFSRKTR